MKISEFNKLIEERRPGSAERPGPAAMRGSAEDPANTGAGANDHAGAGSVRRRPELYRPLKTPVTIRLDADVLDWFKRNSGGRGYQTEINRVLRLFVAELEKSRSGAG